MHCASDPCQCFDDRGTKAGYGNDRVWEGWKAMRPASQPSHTLWKSLRGYHIAAATTTGTSIESNGRIPAVNLNLNPRIRKRLVTNVPGLRCNACSGTLTP